MAQRLILVTQSLANNSAIASLHTFTQHSIHGGEDCLFLSEFISRSLDGNRHVQTPRSVPTLSTWPLITTLSTMRLCADSHSHYCPRHFLGIVEPNISQNVHFIQCQSPSRQTVCACHSLNPLPLFHQLVNYEGFAKFGREKNVIQDLCGRGRFQLRRRRQRCVMPQSPP